MNCIFCKIIKGEIPAKKVFENNKVLAFYDVNPQTSTHILVIHKEHTNSILDTPKDKIDIFNDLFLSVQEIAKELDLQKDGFRVIINNGEGAGQTVKHLHLHILSCPEGLSEKMV